MHLVGQCRGDAKGGLLRVGTLDQLYAAADKRVLLSLSLPLGSSGLVNTPRLPYVLLHAFGFYSLSLQGSFL